MSFKVVIDDGMQYSDREHDDNEQLCNFQLGVHQLGFGTNVSAQDEKSLHSTLTISRVMGATVRNIDEYLCC